MHHSGLPHPLGRRAFARPIVAAFTLLALVTAAAAPARAATEMKPPGGRVALTLPGGYEVSEVFNGFMWRAPRIAIHILELPADAHGRIAGQLTKPALAGKGVRDVASGKLDRTDDYIYLTGKRAHRTGMMTTHYLLLRRDDRAALITANVPVASIEGGLIAKDAIEKVLATASITATPAPANDPFTLAELGPFKPAGRLHAGTRLYTEDGSLVAPKGGGVRNALLVTPSINQLPVTDVRDYAHQAWQGLRGYENLAITEEKPVTAGGLDGYLITGTARKGKGDDAVPMIVSQAFLKRTGGGYYRLVLLGKAADSARLADAFTNILAGFKPKPDPK